MKKYIPRLSVELTEEQNNALSRSVPWGIKKYLFQVLCEALVEAVDEASNDALAAILKRQVKIKLIY